MRDWWRARTRCVFIAQAAAEVSPMRIQRSWERTGTLRARLGAESAAALFDLYEAAFCACGGDLDLILVNEAGEPEAVRQLLAAAAEEEQPADAPAPAQRAAAAGAKRSAQAMTAQEKDAARGRSATRGRGMRRRKTPQPLAAMLANGVAACVAATWAVSGARGARAGA